MASYSLANSCFIKLFTISLMLLKIFSLKAHSSACCAGGAALPTLIIGDYRSQIVLTASNAGVTHDADIDGTIRSRENKEGQEVIETLAFSFSTLISPYWQIGVTLPYRFNTHRTANSDERSRGVGDFRFQLAYEFLPEYSFDSYRPRGFLFLEQTSPTSRSTYTAKKPLRSDALGNGFYTTSLGVALTKTIKSYDFLFMSEIHHSYDREFKDGDEKLEVSSRPGGSAFLSMGLSPFQDNIRLGSTILFSYTGERTIEGIGSSSSISSHSKFYEVGLNLSYLYNNSSYQINYLDQSFLGSAMNTTLSKTLSFIFIKFFEL